MNESLESIIDNHNRRIKGVDGDGDDDGESEDLESIRLDIAGTKNIDKTRSKNTAECIILDLEYKTYLK